MATYRKGILGPVSGKVGDVVGSSWNGKSYLKSLPKNSGKQTTEKQLQQQSRFSRCVTILNPVKDLLGSFECRTKTATAFNLAVKCNLGYAFRKKEDGSSVIDYSRLQFSKGRVGLPGGSEVIAAEGMLYIGWESGLNCYDCFVDDEIRILAYEPVSNTFLRGAAGIFRSEYMAVLHVPGELQAKDLHVYLYCVSREGRHSDTAYVGPVQSFILQEN